MYGSYPVTQSTVRTLDIMDFLKSETVIIKKYTQKKNSFQAHKKKKFLHSDFQQPG